MTANNHCVNCDRQVVEKVRGLMYACRSCGTVIVEIANNYEVNCT